MTGRTLVAGVGNVFLRDDAFGVEVVRLLGEQPRDDGVEIRDFGIRGVHLAYELLNGCDLFVLIDAAPRGAAPGTVSVIDVELPDPASLTSPVIDAHSLTPDSIFALPEPSEAKSENISPRDLPRSSPIRASPP